MTEVRRPRRLQRGDRVAVVAPAGPLLAERLADGSEYLRKWGLQVELMPSAMAKHDELPYLAGDDKARAADFRNAWLDPQYKAVFAGRGGYGVQRTLQHLDGGTGADRQDPRWVQRPHRAARGLQRPRPRHDPQPGGRIRRSALDARIPRPAPGPAVRAGVGQGPARPRGRPDRDPRYRGRPPARRQSGTPGHQPRYSDLRPAGRHRRDGRRERGGVPGGPAAHPTA